MPLIGLEVRQHARRIGLVAAVAAQILAAAEPSLATLGWDYPPSRWYPQPKPV